VEITFLGGATTVTGSQYLVETSTARVLVDCGLFQGSPNEAARNRLPLAYEPGDLDAILLTHAHLDHCGLLPIVVREGFRGPIFATGGTIELAALVLRDSGRLQEEFVERAERRERRDPDAFAAREQRDEAALTEALQQAAEMEAAGGAELILEPQPAGGTQPSGRGAASDRGEPSDAEDAEAALRGQPAELVAELDEPLYTEADAARVDGRFEPVAYGHEVEVAPGMLATFLDAGHILGSAIVRLRVRDTADAGEGGERVIVFSGDLGRPGTPIIRDPTIVHQADYVVVESTYGGRAHEPQAEAVRGLADAVRAVAERDGVLLIPAFAIGRTQEIVWVLDRLIETGRIPLIPLYLDSPMASEASGIYRRHVDCYDAPTRRLLELGATPLDYPRQIVTNRVEQSRAIARARRPYIVVASSGMLTGGRVLAHLDALIDDPQSILLFVGYQGEGTLGAHLQAGVRTVILGGRERRVRCEVRTISGFSAHADEEELLGWLAHLAGPSGATGERAPGRGPRAFIVHGDPEPQRAMAPKVAALGFEVTIPRWRERFALD